MVPGSRRPFDADSSDRRLTRQQQSAVQFGNIVPGVFQPVLAKHSKSFNLIDTLSVGVDRIQRNFEPMRCQVESWRQTQITDDRAKLILYAHSSMANWTRPGACCRRFIASTSSRNTSAFKELDPIPQFNATAKLGGSLETRFSESF